MRTAMEQALHLGCLPPKRRPLDQRQTLVVARTLRQGLAGPPAGAAMLLRAAKGAAEGQQRLPQSQISLTLFRWKPAATQYLYGAQALLLGRQVHPTLGPTCCLERCSCCACQLLQGFLP